MITPNLYGTTQEVQEAIRLGMDLNQLNYQYMWISIFFYNMYYQYFLSFRDHFIYNIKFFLKNLKYVASKP